MGALTAGTCRETSDQNQNQVEIQINKKFLKVLDIAAGQGDPGHKDFLDLELRADHPEPGRHKQVSKEEELQTGETFQPIRDRQIQRQKV